MRLLPNIGKFNKNNSNVENDFIRVYSLKSGESIGFGFNNLEDLNGLVTVSFTDKSDLKHSNTFEFEKFRDLFKTYIKNNDTLLKSSIIDFFSLTINERSEKKEEFKKLFFKENEFLILSYVDNKKKHLSKFSEVKELSSKHYKLVSEYSAKLEKELGLDVQRENLRILEKNFNSSKELFFGSRYYNSQKARFELKQNQTTVISQFYENNSNLKTSIGFNIFNDYILNELESL